VPLIVNEQTTATMTEERDRDPDMVVWWTTEVECESAVAHIEREGIVSAPEAEVARQRLEELSDLWREVEPGEPQRRTARRLLRTHELRAADALQLSAALVVAEGDPAALEFVTLDDRLADAARREGFHVGPQQQV
jgi:predicted nucleic acid-binding protein